MEDRLKVPYKIRTLKAAIRFIEQPCKNHVTLKNCADYYSVADVHVQNVISTLEDFWK